MSGWGCPHSHNDHCNLLKLPCEPGIKGCVLYGQFTFSDPTSPSNEAVERRREKDTKKESGKKDDSLLGD